MNLNIYSKSELLEIYSFLKKYKNLKKTVWNKTGDIVGEKLSWKNRIIVEYFPSLEKMEVAELVINIYKNSFSINITPKDIVWKPNINLKWWIRLFLGNDMIDVSFKNVANILGGI